MVAYLNIAKKYYRIIILLILFLMPNLFLIAIHLIKGEYYTVVRSIYYLSLSAAFFTLPFLFFRNVNSRVLLVIWSPYFLVIPVLVFLVLLYHKFPGRAVLYVILTANKNEIHEFLSGNWFAKLLIIFYIFFLVYLGIKTDKVKFLLSKGNKAWVLIFILILYMATGVFKSIQKQRFMFFSKEVRVKTIKETPLFLAIKLVKTINYIRGSKEGYDQNINTLESYRDNINSKEVYVFVIGESSRYKNWHINGYNRSTSPGIDTLSNLISLKNAYSQSFLTNISVPEMITGYVDDDSTQIYSLIDFFNNQDFHTVWITVQANIPFKLLNIAGKSDTVVSIYSNRQYAFDERLNEELKPILEANHPRLFVVLHQIGSHYPYHYRYPESYGIFKPALSSNVHFIRSDKRKEELINSYDNSILYTDNNLNETIKLIKAQNCISSLIYCSDHGDNLFDGDRQYFGRGYNKISQELYHVPMFVWYSNEYFLVNSERVTNLRLNQDVKYSISNIFESVLGMSGFKLSVNQNNKNIFGDSYLPSQLMVPNSK